MSDQSTPTPAPASFVLHLITTGPGGQVTCQRLALESALLVARLREGPPVPPELLDRTLPLDLGDVAKGGA